MMIRNTIADNMLHAKPTDWVKLYVKSQVDSKPRTRKLSNQTDFKSSITIPAHQLEEYIGSYINPGYGTIKIFHEDDSLYTYFRRRKLRVTPAATDKDIFHAINIIYPYNMAMPPLHFTKNKEGKIASLSIKFESELKAIEFARE